LHAEPERLPRGGTFEIVAGARRFDGTPEPFAEVTFETTAGELASGGAPIVADETGIAIDLLTTYETATVTARSGTSVATTVANVGTGQIGSVDLYCSPVVGPAPLSTTCTAMLVSTDGEPLEGYFLFVAVDDATAVISPQLAETDSQGFATFDVQYLTTDGASIVVSAGGWSSNPVVITIVP
jgi:hypothetical protein